MRKVSLPALISIFIIAQSSFAAPTMSFSRVERLFLEGRYDTVISESEALINSGSGRKDELYYLKGLSELKTDRFSNARASFNRMISNYPWSKKAFDAHLGLGDSYLLEGANAKALGVYNDMAERYHSDKNIAIVYSRLSSCYAKMGLRDKADSYYNMAKAGSPLSFEAKSPPITSESSQSSTRAPGIKIKETSALSVTRGAGKGPYSVQVGSFKNRRNADNLAKKLAACGYESYVAIPVGSGDKFYRAKVGKFETKNEASKLALRLKSEGYNIKICADDICE